MGPKILVDIQEILPPEKKVNVVVAIVIFLQHLQIFT